MAIIDNVTAAWTATWDNLTAHPAYLIAGAAIGAACVIGAVVQGARDRRQSRHQ